jgi:hypothetical protein
MAKSKTLSAFTSAIAKSTSQLTSRNPPISLVSEPEAAAIYALHGLDPHGLQVGDSFVLCDAGGMCLVLGVGKLIFSPFFTANNANAIN